MTAKPAQSEASPPAGDDRLSAYLDGELAGEEQLHLERDLQASPAAQAELTDLREVSTLLKTWDTAVQDENPSRQFDAFVASGGQSVSAELRAQALEDENLPIAPVAPAVGARGLFVRLVLAAAAGLLIYLALHFWVLP